MTTETTSKAAELAEMFETRTRDDGSKFVALKDGSPEWASDFVREAHGTEILPDDYRYRWISEALDLIAETLENDEDADLVDLGSEFADSTDIYTHDLLTWLASHLSRVGYCDQAVQEFGVEEDADLIKRISLGQYMERAEIFAAVVAELATLDY